VPLLAALKSLFAAAVVVSNEAAAAVAITGTGLLISTVVIEVPEATAAVRRSLPSKKNGESCSTGT